MGLGMVFKDTPLLKLFNNQKYLLMSDDQQITKKTLNFTKGTLVNTLTPPHRTHIYTIPKNHPFMTPFIITLFMCPRFYKQKTLLLNLFNDVIDTLEFRIQVYLFYDLPKVSFIYI